MRSLLNLGLVITLLPLSGCVVATVAGTAASAAVSVASTTVKLGTKAVVKTVEIATEGHDDKHESSPLKQASAGH